ncbi:MAG: hypothetical protein M1457_05620, partial [bacterium]|nr:hypothetical protein [bacterium]
MAIRPESRIAWLLLSLATALSPVRAADPAGSLDGWDGHALQGWAWDADQPGAYLSVDFYENGQAGVGTPLGTAVANRTRADLEGTPQAGHAFAFDLPSAVDSRAIYAWARNVGAGADAALPGSPLVVPGDRTEIWFGKFQPWDLGTSNQWEFSKYNADVLLMFIDQINQADINDLRDLVTVLNRYNIKVAVEMGGLVDWRASYGDQSGEESATIEMGKVKKFTDPVEHGGAGGKITYIDMDGPIRRMLYPAPDRTEKGWHTVDSATDELVDSIRMWKTAYPDVKIFVLTNFPNWGWKGGPAYHNFSYTAGAQGYGDYHQVIQMIVAKTRAAGLPVSGVTVDNPHDYANYVFTSNQPSVTAGIDWFARMLDLEAYIEGEGLDFNLIFNCSKGGTPARGGTNQLYHDHSLQYVDEYHSRGGTPARYIFESWYTLPSIWVPESDPYSMMGLV